LPNYLEIQKNTNMITMMVVFIALICLLLMVAILIQNPKGGGVDSTFGGTASNQVFGATKSADFIEKATWYLAAALFILCIITSVMVSGGGGVEALPNMLPEG
jgi:preprotein translocase subunit SecG